MSKFGRVAVLNRGEAALRFMRGAQSWSRKSGRELESVAFYTSIDAEAPFVKMATRAVALGEPFVDSAQGRRLVYVDLEALMGHVVACGADAVWPGWGFLAENPLLPEACARLGVNFIGPPPEAMRTMADKVAAKRLAAAQGVPVAPWSEQPVVDAEQALFELERIGYPALLKSSAGGGGRGIRLVERADEVARQFQSASAEALATSGDGALFIEAFIPRARHIEVQILADAFGAVWTLGTRDCSVQRRNQKVIEEAPAPNLNAGVEAQICRAAEALARACGYVGVGTAEFLLLPDERTFYFLEMNTRLQVEHTVTEAVYGFDLVCAQIDVAQGARLDAMERPQARGAAVEARLNAEDPDDHFAPRTGTLVRFVPPQGPWVRVDAGYAEGNTIPSAFDSNIAKIITWGSGREDALARMEAALHDTLCGVETGLTNRALLLEVVASPEFRRGPVWTRWLDEHLVKRARPHERAQLVMALAAAAIGDHLSARRQDLLLFFAEALSGLPRRVPKSGPRALKYRVGSELIDVQVATLSPMTYHVCCGPWEAVVKARSTGNSSMLLEVDGRRYTVLRITTSSELKIEVEGIAHCFERVSDGCVLAPIPSAVSFVHVQVGEVVNAGDRLITLEAMKMEFPVASPLRGTVRRLLVAASDSVAVGDLLVEIEAELAEGDGPGATEQTPRLNLPAQARTPLQVADVLMARLLGYDVEQALFERALAMLHADEAQISSAALIGLLSAHLVKECLFLNGEADDAANEARESSRDQLGWFLRQRRFDDDVLEARFEARLRFFFKLHDITDLRAATRADNALMRLFQARADQPSLDAIAVGVLDALERKQREAPERAALVEQGFSWAGGEVREVLEQFAVAAANARKWHLAARSWNFIVRWCGTACSEHRALVAALASAQLERWGEFAMEALEVAPGAPIGLWLARHREVSDDVRVVVVGQVDAFDVVDDAGALRVPALEEVLLEAATAIRRARARFEGERLVWNRITLVVAAPIELDDADLHRLARRLAPQTLDLGLEKVVLSATRAGERVDIELANAVGMGPNVHICAPDERPVASISRHERGIVKARERGLFYPYEVVTWLCQTGSFEELDLEAEDSLALCSVKGRAFGENSANLVVGCVSNASARFGEGICRVLIVGDATRTMGSLGEAECRRIVGAIDWAQRHQLPIEWVALSSGARISFDSGTENLDWTAQVLRRVVEFTQAGGTIHVIVDGPCVGAQSYWNAEATMLMHCKGALVMTPRGYMILTGRKALEYSGSVAAETNEGIGGLEIMVPNGQAQYVASDLFDAYRLLFAHYELTHVAPGERYSRKSTTSDAAHRDACTMGTGAETDFASIAEIFDDASNPGRKRPFAIRAIMAAVLDQDIAPLERWAGLDGAESAVTWHGQLGGQPVTLIGIESRPVRRKGFRPIDGPESWMSGTLFPQSSRKVARALQAASGVHPAVVLANLSGFDGSPESLRERQLEWGAEIARAVVNFQGPIVFCVISRYHGGAFVVFSQALNPRLQASALEGTFASVIGGAPAAAVVFPSLVDRRASADDRIRTCPRTPGDDATFDALYQQVRSELQAQVAREFDAVHSIERARNVGSLCHIIAPGALRAFLCEQVAQGVEAYLG
ncbi:MAG: ATP-grasp domain-containing protein [Bradymonadaceae bacterium]|nr:ATP-grasp domain-containing protein [Lujinxingiaceae bacterium]